MFKSIEDLQKFSKEQFDAAAQSATAFSNGFQQLLAETTEFSKKSFETNTDAVQKLFGSRSVDRAFQVHMDYTKAAYESMIAESSKISGIMSSTAQDVFKPLEGVLAQVQNAVRPNSAA
jgi:phasin family protein